MLVWTIARRFAHSLRGDGFSRFTSTVSVAAIALGSLALILSISILTGYEERILETATRFTSHVEVRSAYPEGITLSAEELAQISSMEDVQRIDPILVREALARTRSGIDGVVIQGLTAERCSTTIAPALTTGTLPSGGSCVVGEEVAHRLGLTVGDTLLLYASDQQRTEPIMFASQISGIVRTGMQSVDASLVVMQNRDLASVLGQDALHPTMLAIQLHNPERAQRVAIRLLTQLPRGYLILTWKDRFANVANWIALQRQPIPIVLGLISIVAVFTLVSTLLVAVVLKTRSLAILSSLGMSPTRIMCVALVRGVRLGVTGSLIGTGLAWTFVFAQHQWQFIQLDGAIYYVSSLPVSLAPAPFILVPLVTIVLSVCASVVPMIAARRIQVVQALRFG